jgi:hypothetical protein
LPNNRRVNTLASESSYRGGAQGEDCGANHEHRQPGARRDLGEHPETGRRERQAAGHHEGRADPARHQWGEHGASYEPTRRRQHPKTSLKRREPEYELEVLGDEEEGTGYHEDAEQERGKRGAERRFPEEPEVDQRVVQLALSAREQDACCEPRRDNENR